MIYSKRVQELQTIYSLTPQCVLFAMLAAAGASRPEAYAAIFRPQLTSPASLAGAASRLANEHPGINKLIEALTTTKTLNDPTRRDPKTTKTTKKGGKQGGEYTEKSAVIAAISAEVDSLRGKDRVDALMKIADLQQMKKEDNAEEAERVIYYLPLRCKSCELYRAEAKKQAARAGK